MGQILDNIKILASESTRQAGFRYYLQRRVTIISYNDNVVQAIVRGSHDNKYNVIIKFNKNNIVQSYSCTCPCDFFCKHCVATIYELQNLIDKSAKQKISNIKSINLANKLEEIISFDLDTISRSINEKSINRNTLDSISFLNKHRDVLSIDDISKIMKKIKSLNAGFEEEIYFFLLFCQFGDFNDEEIKLLIDAFNHSKYYSGTFFINDILYVSSFIENDLIADYFIHYLISYNIDTRFYETKKLNKRVNFNPLILRHLISILSSWQLDYFLYLVCLEGNYKTIYAIKDKLSLLSNYDYIDEVMETLLLEYDRQDDLSTKSMIKEILYLFILNFNSFKFSYYFVSNFIKKYNLFDDFITYIKNNEIKSKCCNLLLFAITKDDSYITTNDLLIDNAFAILLPYIRNPEIISNLKDILYEKLIKMIKSKKQIIDINAFVLSLIKLKDNRLSLLLSEDKYIKYLKANQDIYNDVSILIKHYFLSLNSDFKKFDIDPSFNKNQSVLDALSKHFRFGFLSFDSFLYDNIELIKAFQNNSYNFYYKINDLLTEIEHFAFLKPEYFSFSYPLYLKFSINKPASIIKKDDYSIYQLNDSFNDRYSFYTNSLVFIYYYINKSVDDFSNIHFDYYKDDEEFLLNIFSKKTKDFNLLVQSRKDFMSISEQISSLTVGSEKSIKSDSLLDLLYIIEPDSYNSDYLLSAKIGRIGQNKIYIKNIYQFLTSYLNNQKYELSPKENIILFKNNFKSELIDSLDFLSPLAFKNEPDYAYLKKNITLSKSQLSKLLLLLKGEEISYLGNKYLISKIETEGEVNLTKDNQISISPLIKKENILFQEGKYVAFLASDSPTIKFINFPSPSLALLFEYFSLHGVDSFSNVKDIFVKKVLPKISSSLIKAKSSNKEENLFNIKLYIELDGKSILHFNSEFYFENKKCTVNDFKDNVYCFTIYDNYSQILSSLGGVVDGEIKEQDDVLTFLKADQSELRKIASIYLNERLKNLNIDSSFKIQINVKKNQGWLDVSFSNDKYSKEELIDILSAYRKKKKFIRLGNDFILLDNQSLKDSEEIMKELSIDDKTLENNRVPFFESMKLDLYKDKNVDINFDDYLTKAFKDIRNFYKNEVDKSNEIIKQMRPYQINAVKWLSTLSKYHLSGILSDDMGLGKTLETIGFIDTIQENSPILVISPKSLIYNWGNEISKWALDKLPYMIIEGSKQYRKKCIEEIDKANKKVYIISYDTLRNDLDLFAGINFSLIILDEAQFIKNAHALKSKAVKKLSSTYRLALTGTPLENSMLDLWSIFDFLMPNYLGTYNSFMKNFANNSDDKDVIKYVKKKVAPFILRRSKEDVLKDLPPKTITPITINMESEQRKIYDAYLLEAKNEISNSTNKLQVLKTLTRLRQICADPSSFLENYNELSAKLSFCVSLVNDCIINGHKILIFSAFTKVLDHLKFLLENENIPSYYINGETPSSLRLQICEKFNKEDKIKVVLISLKAGGTGLNLFGADTVIHFDPWWNIAAEEQASDRAHRIGQTKPVQIYKLICHDTIEEKVIKLQENKKELYKSLIDSNDEAIKNISDEDIKFILS